VNHVNSDLSSSGALWYHHEMAMTLRLSPELDADLRLIAEEDHRSLSQTIVVAIEAYISARWTEEVLADSETLRALAEAENDVRKGNVVDGVDAMRALLESRLLQQSDEAAPTTKVARKASSRRADPVRRPKSSV